jgi:hypothetical protein
MRLTGRAQNVSVAYTRADPSGNQLITTAVELQKLFGSRIAALVIAASDDDRIRGYAERKAALRQQLAGAGDGALTLFAADKLSKLRELRRETAIDYDQRRAPGRSPSYALVA